MTEERMSKEDGKHYAYMLKCADGTIYSGYTNDLEHRTKAHNDGCGAKYTRARLPVVLMYYEVFDTKSEALKCEWRFKKMTHAQKEALILGFEVE